LKDLVKPRIASCKAGQSLRIVIDFGDLAYMDSSGLGAVVGLKVSSLTRGDGCSLELVHLSPRVAELLRLANLTQLFYLKPNPGSAFAFHAEALNASHRTTEPENK
jgi:anti-sigma B factor antagonist